MAQISTKFLANDAVNEDKLRLSNDGALKARNAANSADVELFKLDTSDLLQFLSHPQISSSAVNADDIITKKDLDSNLEGLKPKEAVRVATTANITLSGTQTIDGVSLVAGDRVLVWNQTTVADNGIYVVAAGAWARAEDMNSVTPIDEVNGAYTMAQEGSTYAGWSFVQFGTVTTLGTDDLTFTVRANTTFTGGDGIDITGTTFSVDHDGEGLTFALGQLSLELDGSTLSKSATGLKVADNGITEAQLASDIDAESFQLSTNYASAAGTVTIGDTIEVAIEKLNGNFEARTPEDINLTAGYAAAAGTVTIGDSVEVAIEKLDGNIQAISGAQFAQETFTLDGTDISNQYVDLVNLATANSVHLIPDGGPAQIEGVDFTIADAGGFTRLTFAGDLASGGAAALVATDVIYVKYSY